MSPISKIALGALASMLLGSTAMAADLMAPPPVEAAMTSDWTGGYIGAGIEADHDQGSGNNFGEIDAILGANFQSGMFLAGVQGWVGYDRNLTSGGGDQWTAGIEGRAGFVVGDTALLYGALGYEYYAGSGNTYYMPGVGVEFMLSDSASVNLEYVHYMGANNSNVADGVRAQLLWHFK